MFGDKKISLAGIVAGATAAVAGTAELLAASSTAANAALAVKGITAAGGALGATIGATFGSGFGLATGGAAIPATIPMAIGGFTTGAALTNAAATAVVSALGIGTAPAWAPVAAVGGTIVLAGCAGLG